MSDDDVQTFHRGDFELAFRIAGSGPDLVVLLHGWPQTGRCWRKIVPTLAEQHTVLVPDLRGYGASGLTRTGYDKRATASDLSALIRHLGHDSAAVVGHDRGARVAHRWALDQPSEVAALALLEVLPTRVAMNAIDRDAASTYWHWFFHVQPDLPELLIGENVEPYIRHFLSQPLQSGAIDEQTLEHYVKVFSEPGHLHASLEDYRAQFGADLALDEADHSRGRRIQCPLLVLWGRYGSLQKYDVTRTWQDHHDAPEIVHGQTLPAGHYLPEESPDHILRELSAFFAGAKLGPSFGAAPKPARE